MPRSQLSWFWVSSPYHVDVNRPQHFWSLNDCCIPEVDEQHHLGVLRTVHFTSVHRTVKRCRFGCLHPRTSLKLYSSLCLPIMHYGCELWTPTKSEVLMLERVHRKILRTIQGLPVRCHHLVSYWCFQYSLSYSATPTLLRPLILVPSSRLISTACIS